MGKYRSNDRDLQVLLQKQSSLPHRRPPEEELPASRPAGHSIEPRQSSNTQVPPDAFPDWLFARCGTGIVSTCAAFQRSEVEYQSRPQNRAVCGIRRWLPPLASRCEPRHGDHGWKTLTNEKRRARPSPCSEKNSKNERCRRCRSPRTAPGDDM